MNQLCYEELFFQKFHAIKIQFISLIFAAAEIGTVTYVDECFRNSRLSSVRSRVLIGDGELVKMCRKKPMVRHFFLFNDVLVYGNVVTANKTYDKQRIIPLQEVVLEQLVDGGGKKIQLFICLFIYLT